MQYAQADAIKQKKPAAYVKRCALQTNLKHPIFKEIMNVNWSPMKLLIIKLVTLQSLYTEWQNCDVVQICGLSR